MLSHDRHASIKLWAVDHRSLLLFDYAVRVQAAARVSSRDVASRTRGPARSGLRAMVEAQQPRGFRDGRVIYMGNDAVFGQGVRDSQLDGRPVPDSGVGQQLQHHQQQHHNTKQQTQADFEGLTPEARYGLDTYGVCVLESVLSASELDAARAAFDRVAQLPAVDRLDDNLDHLRSIIMEPALEALACHPALLPALVELHRGEPHLVSASLNHKPQCPVDQPAQNGAQLHGGSEFANRRGCGDMDTSVGAEIPGRLHIENCVVFPYLDTVHDGDGGLLIIPGSHKNEFPRPPELFGPYATQYEKDWDVAREQGAAGPAGWEAWDWSRVPDGSVNLTPTAGDIVIMREAPTGCLHGVMPWTSTTRQRRTLTMRYKSGPEWVSHRDHPDHVARARHVDLYVRRHLGLPQPKPLQLDTVALVSGDSATLIDSARSALAVWKPPSAPNHRGPLWRSGQNPSCTLLSASSRPTTAEMRFLMDCFGFLHLKQVLSPAEVAAAREAYSHALVGGPRVIGNPALEQLITDARLLPIYKEFAGDDELHCVSAGLLHDPPRSEDATLRPGHLHCQREYDRYHAQFSTRPSECGDGKRRISLNNFVTFPYLDTVRPDDGGLLVVPGSHKSVFSRPRSLFNPYGNPPGLGGPDRPQLDDWPSNTLQIPVPDGCWHVRPEPGDVVIMAETLTHGIRPWSSKYRSRRALAIRYKAGAAYEEHMAAWQAKEDKGEDALPDWMQRTERVHSGMSFGTRWDPGTLHAASTATLALIEVRAQQRL